MLFMHFTPDSKICIERHKCNLCETSKQYIGIATCTQNQKCDVCALSEEKCQCMTKNTVQFVH